MARKLVYNIERFDGGITDNIRTSDLSKCAHVSHFDIYSDPNRLVPMPGYIADQDTVAGGANDLQNYNVRAFTYASGSLYCVGEASGGGGSQVFSKASPTTASWTAESNSGTDNLAENTFLHYDSGGRLYFVTNALGNTYLSYHQIASTTTDKHATLQTGSTTTLQHVVEYAFDDEYYFNTGQDDIGKIAGTTVTDPVKDTAMYVTDIQSGNEQLGLIGYRFYPYRSQLLLWDSASTLIDRKIELGFGRTASLGFIHGTWVVALNESAIDLSGSDLDEQMNGRHELVVKYISGDQALPLVRIPAVVSTSNDIFPSRSKYRDSMLFYGKFAQDATPTNFKEGIWAVGRCTDNSPLALSLLFDTSDLGSMEGFYGVGNHFFFAHGGDGSVSRLDDFRTGTYDVDAEYHSLMFGSDSPFLKDFNGISVLTEDLPASASVTVYYRLDEDDSWTSLGSSSTTGTETHNFTRASSAPIGKFREIQFRVVVSGKVAIKNIVVSINETDDLPFNV